MDPFTASAVIGGGVSLLNNLLGFGAQDSAQDFNVREAEKNRQFQAKQLDSQYFYNSQLNKQSQEFQSEQSKIARDWEEQMYNLYNSPSAMMEQYKKAGLNPYLGASGQTGAGMGTSAPISGSPAQQGVGLPAGSQASSPGAFRPSLAADYASIAGVNAQAANQNAQTTALNWKTYEDIYYHVGKDAAKHFLSGHPEMFQSDDPENAPYMQSYRRAEVRENLENSILSTRDWLQDRYGYQNAEKVLAQADAQIENLFQSANLSKEKASAVVSEILQNLASAHMLEKQGNYYSASAETVNQLREHLVSQALLSSGLLGLQYLSELPNFESLEEVRVWLKSDEAKKSFGDAAKMQGWQNGNSTLFAIDVVLDRLSKISSIYNNMKPKGNTYSPTYNTNNFIP